MYGKKQAKRGKIKEKMFRVILLRIIIKKTKKHNWQHREVAKQTMIYLYKITLKFLFKNAKYGNLNTWTSYT